MGRESAWANWATGFVLLASVFAGCRGPASRFTGSYDSNSRSGGEAVDLTPYLATPIPATRTYLQVNPDDPGEPSRRYEQRYVSAGRVGGSLIGRFDWPLTPYFDRDSNRPNRPRVAWPTGEGRAVEAFLIEFDPPIAEWPATIRPGEAVEAVTRMRVFDRWGIPFAEGSARRWVRLGEIEDVVSGEVTFTDCVRLESDTDLWFGWWAFVSLRETVWFARGGGLVRRVERIKGNALLIFRFNSTHEYELLNEAVAQPSTDRSVPVAVPIGVDTEAVGAARELPGHWARLAICLDRGVPRPRIGGLAVEWSRDP
ncbi:MAG: hypothetical protein Q7R41_19350 [Phycisphaerales bacterium]|nr:hypothetical protein [Phycisphaerales bacterium]